MFKLAELFVEIGANTRPLTEAMAGVRRTLTGAASGAAGAFAGVGAALAGVGAVAGLAKSVKLASDLGEAVDSAKTTFGAAYGQIEAQANSLNKQFGLSVKSQIEMADGFGTVAQGAGMAEQASAEFANTWTKLAGDFSSKKNLSFDEAFTKLQSALAGEAEPLRRYVGNVDEAAVKNYAFAKGLAKVGTELDANTKFQARAGLIMEKMSKVTGDLERTQDSSANQMRKFGGLVETAGVKIGQALLPGFGRALMAVNSFVAGATPTLESWAATAGTAVGVALDWLGDFAAYLQTWSGVASAAFGVVKEWVVGFAEGGAAAVGEFLGALREFVASDTIGGWASNTMSALQSVGAAFDYIGLGLQDLKGYVSAAFEFVTFTLRNFDTVVALTRVNVTEFCANVVAAFTAMGETMARLFTWLLNNWQNLLADMVAADKAILSNLMENAKAFGAAFWDALKGKGFNFDYKPLLDGFKATTEAMPDIAKPVWVDMAKDREAILDGVYKKEADRIAGLNDKAKAATAPGAAPAKEGPAGKTPEQYAKPAKAKGAEFSDLTSFAKSIQTGAFGKDDAGKQTAKYTEATAKGVQQLVENSKKPAAPQPGYAVGAA